MEFADSLQALGFSNLRPFDKRKREILYATAYGMYQVGDYSAAADHFTLLALQDPHEAKYWKGLAASRQMQKEYRAALQAWATFALVSGHDPSAHFHACECFLSLGELEDAKKALALAENYIKGKEKIQLLKERISNAH